MLHHDIHDGTSELMLQIYKFNDIPYGENGYYCSTMTQLGSIYNYLYNQLRYLEIHLHFVPFIFYVYIMIS